MAERQAVPQPEQEPSQGRPLERLASQFDVELEAVADPVFGAGQRLELGPERQLAIELYPETGTVCLTSQHSRIELFRQPIPTLQDELLLFSRDHGDEEIQLTIDAQGLVALQIQPHDAPATLEEADLPVSDLEREPDPSVEERSQQNPFSSLQDAVPMTIETADDKPVTTVDPSEDKEVQPRLTITGWLGRDPHFRTTRNGALVASFPVAVLEEDGSTTWHRVVAFRERAKKLRDALQSGDRVEVIGYLHQRERQTSDGAPRAVEEVYAAVIKPR